MSSTTLLDPTSDSSRARSRDRRVRGILRESLLWVVATLGAASICLFALCVATGVRPQIVVSGSMEPSLPVGSLVLAQPVPAAEIAVGDVVSVERPEGRGLVTHRVVEVTDAGHGARELTLKGDANATVDPVTYTVLEAGRVVYTIPVVGAMISMLKTPWGLGILGALLVVLFIAVLRRPTRERSRSTQRPDTAAPS